MTKIKSGMDGSKDLTGLDEGLDVMRVSITADSKIVSADSKMVSAVSKMVWADSKMVSKKN